jgi:hypothetical protein
VLIGLQSLGLPAVQDDGGLDGAGGGFPEVDLTDDYFNEHRPSGLEPAVLKYLPVAVNTRAGEHVCVICLNQLKLSQHVTSLPGCAHTFHSRCIKTWLELQDLCPLCQRKVKVKKTAANLAKIQAIESARSFASRLGWRS